MSRRPTRSEPEQSVSEPEDAECFAEALQESEERFRAIFDGSLNAIFLADPESGVILDANPAAEELLGLPLERIVGLHQSEVHPPSMREYARERFTCIARQEDLVVPTRTTVLCSDGTEKTCEITAQVIQIEGKPLILGEFRDITERERLDRELLQEKRIRDAIFDSVPGVIYLVDEQGSLVRWNSRLEVITGYSGQEVARMRPLHFYVEEERARVAQQVREAFASGHAEIEATVLTKSGAAIPFYFTAVPLEIEGKRYVAGMGIDTTARRRAEDALRESLETWRVFFNAVPLLAALVDTQGCILEANEAFARRFGRQASELLGTGVWGLLPPSLARNRKAFLDQALHSGQTLGFQDENQGTWFDNQLFPILDEQGKVARVAGLARDITEEKRAREALEASEQRYRAVVENQTELICRLLPDNTLSFVNDAYCRCFTKTREELMGKNFTLMIPEDERGKVEQHLASISPQKPVETHEQRVLAPDGTIRWQQWTNQGIFDAQGRLVEYQSVGRDVTERKQLEREIVKLEKLDSLGVLAGGIAHDFNNLLMAITANVSMAQTFGKLPEDISGMLADAETAAWRARNLTQQLLTFSRGGAPVRKPMPIAKLVMETAGFALSGSNIRSDFSLPEDLWLADIDEGQISQVVQNLVINAKQAMPEGGTIRLSAENVKILEQEALPLSPGRYIRLSVQDQGTGIPEKHVTRIFDPFFTTKHQGSGLGLTICFSIVKGHQGHIRADSVMGAGTTFHVYLPAAADAGPWEATAKAKESPRRGQGRILLVDDDDQVRGSAGKALTRLGYEVESAGEGGEGVARYEEAMRVGNPFAAVILDLTIPGGMGGREAIQLLRKIDPQVRAIASSGYSNDPLLSSYETFGFSGVLTKPYGVSELAEVLQRVIRSGQ